MGPSTLASASFLRLTLECFKSHRFFYWTLEILAGMCWNATVFPFHLQLLNQMAQTPNFTPPNHKKLPSAFLLGQLSPCRGPEVSVNCFEIPPALV